MKFSENINFAERKRFSNKAVTFKSALSITLLLTLLLWYSINLMSLLFNTKKEGLDLALNALLYQDKNKGLYFPIFILSAILVIVYFTKHRTIEKNIDLKQKGTNRWTTRKEIEEQYKAVAQKDKFYEGDSGKIIAFDPDKKCFYVDTSTTNTLTVGITRSGKDENLILPQIDVHSRAEKQPSLIIPDPKFETSNSTLKTLEKRGYDCYILNFIDMYYSSKFNPLEVIANEYIYENKDNAILLARNFANNIFEEKGSKDVFWEMTASNLTAVLILALIEDGINEAEKRSYIEAERKFQKLIYTEKNPFRKYLLKVRQVYESYISLTDKEFSNKFSIPIFIIKEAKKINLPFKIKNRNYHKKVINMHSLLINYGRIKDDEKLIKMYFLNRPDNSQAKNKYMIMTSGTENVNKTISAVILSKLFLFTYENVAKLTSESSFDIFDFGFSEKPKALFLALPDHDKTMLPLVSILIEQFYFILSKSAAHSKNKKLKRRVIFMLNEFGSLPALPNIDQIATVGAGRGILLDLYLQSFSQMDNNYGKERSATIKGNCGNWCYLMCNDVATNKEFSEFIGTETFINVDKTMNADLNNKATSYRASTEERQLIKHDELTKLKEGENVFIRTMYRKDLKGKDITQYPIANLGKYRFPRRYEYLLDIFKQNEELYNYYEEKLYHDIEVLGDIDLSEHLINLTPNFTRDENINLLDEKLINFEFKLHEEAGIKFKKISTLNEYLEIKDEITDEEKEKFEKKYKTYINLLKEF